MPNTFTQIHIQAVFAVKYRQALIHPHWKEELNKYITGIIHHNGHRVLAINGPEDHIHLFFGYRPIQGLSELMQDVKSGSSGWINARGFCRHKFQWQAGYGAFSYKKSDVQTIIDYIRNQEQHHMKTSFREEYKSLLEEFEIAFDSRYTFHAPV